MNLLKATKIIQIIVGLAFTKKMRFYNNIFVLQLLIAEFVLLINKNPEYVGTFNCQYF